MGEQICTYKEKKYKGVVDLEKGDILKRSDDSGYYPVLGYFSQDRRCTSKRKYYFYFGSFIAHGQILNTLFKNGKYDTNKVIVYEKIFTNKKEEVVE